MRDLATKQPNMAAQTVNELGQTHNLYYYLQEYKSTDNTTLYGIKVERCEPSGKQIDEKETYAICSTVEEATELMQILANGAVIPVTSVEVASDWLVERARNKKPKPESKAPEQNLSEEGLKSA